MRYHPDHNLCKSPLSSQNSNPQFRLQKSSILKCAKQVSDPSLSISSLMTIFQAGEITYTNTNQPRVGEGIVEFGSRLPNQNMKPKLSEQHDSGGTWSMLWTSWMVRSLTDEGSVWLKRESVAGGQGQGQDLGPGAGLGPGKVKKSIAYCKFLKVILEPFVNHMKNNLCRSETFSKENMICKKS